METIGIIGGSGLYSLEGLENIREVTVDTPFGKPSAALVTAQFAGRSVVFLPRHGRAHHLNPSEINYRANIYALKNLGVGWIVSVTACGSLKEELKPLDFVVPTQFLDRTNQGRTQTFFDRGIVAHISFAQPVCLDFARSLHAVAKDQGVTVHMGGTYVNMEGPQFSTLAESTLYRSWGMDIIGMTNMVEARLAREAEMCYATLAAVTDYDCWHETAATVTIDVILENVRKNVENAKNIIRNLIPVIPQERTCSCGNALQYAIVTQPDTIPQETKKRLDILIRKYISS